MSELSASAPGAKQASHDLLSVDDMPADLERRFGGLRRLYGEQGYARVRASRVVVVGVGGVGSWATEALARCGVAQLVLIDLDHVAESNVNRQIQALHTTLGQSKVLALRERVAQIHPGCEVVGVEEFVNESNWPSLWTAPVDCVIDACDDRHAKWALAAWALRERRPLIVVGAAGGKSHAHRVEVADLLHTTHDALLAQLRQRLRKAGLLPTAGATQAKTTSGLTCVFSREESRRADEAPGMACVAPDTAAEPQDTSLNCHGFGSVVTVTAVFGMVAADAALRVLNAPPTV